MENFEANSNYKNYIEGNYILSLYNNKEFERCKEECEKNLSKDYAADNPVRFLVRLISAAGEKYEMLYGILISFYNNKKEQLDAISQKNLLIDIYSLSVAAGNKENSEYWKKEYIKNKSLR